MSIKNYDKKLAQKKGLGPQTPMPALTPTLTSAPASNCNGQRDMTARVNAKKRCVLERAHENELYAEEANKKKV